MKRLFQYIIIRLTTRHAKTAAEIYESIFNPSTPQPILIFSSKQVTQVNGSNEKITTLSPAPIDKKQEIMEALDYLKSKDIKSKQDKGSISMLEGVLATMV
jgi:hypothetical protein